MDIQKFISEKERMCRFYKHRCNDCYLYQLGETLCNELDSIYIYRSQVEAWSKKYPAKTVKQALLEAFPNAVIGDSILDLMPCSLTGDCNDPMVCRDDMTDVDCQACAQRLWNKEWC